MQNKWTKEIVIKNGKHATYRHRNDLRGMGFTYEPHKGSGTWTLHADCDKYEIKQLRNYCKRKKLQITVTDRNLTRSQTYRKNYAKKADMEKIRCAYCGKKLTPRTMTVDHIFPVSRFKGNRSKGALGLLGIKNINEYKNLAPACHRCNQKKGSKEGIWVLRGLIGKHYAVRTVMNVVRALLIIAAIVFLMRGIYALYQTNAGQILSHMIVS